MEGVYYNLSPVKRFYSEIIYSVGVPYMMSSELYKQKYAAVDVNIKFHEHALGIVLAIKNNLNINPSERYTDKPWNNLQADSTYNTMYAYTGINFQVIDQYSKADTTHEYVDDIIQSLVTTNYYEQPSPNLFIQNIPQTPQMSLNYV
ncbi:hypothetical protein EXVG_00264 [Emiliania huxleyi virus 202]|nr:hypothetical protein EXVG_00264 [Emiliania huxleyi virus 202]AHA54118.1 hypothetical protein EhV18_00067 [Emiliania huxleyi virus 18]AHA55165.1 hypothetical protein EhV156_00064 [Emiliania huxleyi virus 156]